MQLQLQLSASFAVVVEVVVVDVAVFVWNWEKLINTDRISRHLYHTACTESVAIVKGSKCTPETVEWSEVA